MPYLKGVLAISPKGNPIAALPQTTQNLAQQQHVHNSTGANMVGSNTPTDDNQENEITNARTDFTLEEERQIQQLAKDLRSGRDRRVCVSKMSLLS